jgi:hypothetical protein
MTLCGVDSVHTGARQAGVHGEREARIIVLAAVSGTEGPAQICEAT